MRAGESFVFTLKTSKRPIPREMATRLPGRQVAQRVSGLGQGRTLEPCQLRARVAEWAACAQPDGGPPQAREAPLSTQQFRALYITRIAFYSLAGTRTPADGRAHATRQYAL
jgi:hypothetical protein